MLRGLLPAERYLRELLQTQSMARKVDTGQYKIGRVKQKPYGPRPSECGEFGVVKGSKIESSGHVEFSHICEGIIKTSKWAVYRIGPGDNGSGTQTDLLHAADSKQAGVNWLKKTHGGQFDETY